MRRSGMSRGKPQMTVQTVWGHGVLLGLSAVLLGLAFPRPGMWLLGYVALVPWGYACVRSEKLWRLCWTSFVVFMLFWLVRVGWVIPVTAAGYVVLSGIMAGYVAIGSVLLWLIARRTRLLMVVAVPVVWVGMEFLRSHYPAGGFGWFTLGYAVGSYQEGQGAGIVAQIANVFGVWGVSFVVAMTSGLIVDLMTQKMLHMRRTGAKTVRKTVRGAVVIWVLVYGCVMVHGLVSVGRYDRMIEEAGDRVRGVTVGVVQTDDVLSNTSFRDQDELWRDWGELVEWTREVGMQEVDGERVQIVVWPESVAPTWGLNAETRAFLAPYGGIISPTDIHEQIGRLAREYGLNVFVGAQSQSEWGLRTVQRKTFPVAEVKSNSTYLYYADGVQSPTRYSKMILVPVGEYWPWIENWPGLKNWIIEKFSPWGDYTLDAGERVVVFEVPVLGRDVEGMREVEVVKAVTPICYEDVVPWQVRRMVYEGGKKRADLIVNLTNSGWYSGMSMRLQHMQIAAMRSVENGVPTARSVNTGVSGFVDAVGRVVKVVKDEEGEVQYVGGSAAEFVRFDERVTVYGRIGDVGAWVLVGVLLVVTVMCVFGRGGERGVSGVGGMGVR
ncbi:Apolipoprotein N-acyltransferase [Poriferisphaera corsica]|uniref:Apolipoprotein N-acyltransferase n=1 Tax=Poriferisphaera corsica TaxID=2528020 RepID=A0A517YSL4_9BACT|nr:apolipoprotein N-acyltransferase [Poriferisphaera corsica]QDU33208.1 Apolipoprotein N-acyltransferase [Poriferisphaera corsica]